MPVPSSQSGPSGSSAVPAALARAWQVLLLYDRDHPVIAQRITELCQATASAESAVRLYIEPGVVVCSGAALEPKDHFAPLAEVLGRARISVIELRGRLEPAQALEVLNLLQQSRSGDEEFVAALPKRLADASNGAVRTRDLPMASLRLTPGAAANTLAVHQLDQRGSGTSRARHVTATAGDPSGRAGAAMTEVLGTLARMDDRSPAAADLESVREAVARLSDQQRLQLLEFLGQEGTLAFDDAARMLSLMPVRDVAQAISVLERPDARLSSTALMLVRRLASLSLGSTLDMDRLARLAETWVTQVQEGQEHANLAQPTVDLLKRITVTEFACPEYVQLLNELSGSATGDVPMHVLVSDDLAQIDKRLVNVLCDAMSTQELSSDVSGPLRMLAQRTAAVADLGHIDLVMRATALGRGWAGEGKRESERKAAGALLQAAETQRWTARALAGAPQETVARAIIGDLQAAYAPAAEIYVAALALALTASRQTLLIACRDTFSPDELRKALLQHITRDRRAAGAVAALIEVAYSGEAVDLLRPALLSDDPDHRSEAFAALRRIAPLWPRELYVRGIIDQEESVRLVTIEALRQAGRCGKRLLVARLAGCVGEQALSFAETTALLEALADDRSASFTRRIAFVLALRSWLPMYVPDCTELARALQLRRRTLSSVVALALWWLSPLQMVRRRRRGGAGRGMQP